MDEPAPVDRYLDELARQHATPGGQNERLLAGVRAAGVYDSITRELDRLLKA